MVPTGSPAKRFIEDNGLKKRGQGGRGLTQRLGKEGGRGETWRLGMRAAGADKTAEAGLGFCRVRKKLVLRRWNPDGGRPQDGERLEKAAKRRWDRGASGGELGCGVGTVRSVDDGASRLATLRGGERTGNKR